MKYLELPPSPKLGAVIKHFWSIEQSAEDTLGSVETVLPDGCPELVFNFSDRFRRYTNVNSFELQPQALFAGQITKRIQIGPTGKVDLFGVRFHPFGAVAVLRISVTELKDSIEVFDAKVTKMDSSVYDRLLQVETFAERISIFEEELMKMLPAATLPQKEFCRIVDALGSLRGARISEFAEKIGWTERRLEREFNRYIGVTPKAFARIARFASIVKALETFGPDELVELAYRFGYYDQSHLINEFREFAGLSPTSFYKCSHRMSELFTLGE